MYTIDDESRKKLTSHLKWQFAAKGDALGDMPRSRAEHTVDVLLFVLSRDHARDEQAYREQMHQRAQTYPRSTRFVCQAVKGYFAREDGTPFNDSRLRELIDVTKTARA